MKNYLPVLVLAASFALGCSGASSNVVAPDAKYPLSLSDGLRDENGRLLEDNELEVVGAFEADYTAWGMWWNIISFTGDADISDEVNEQVAAAKGEGIVNLAVRSKTNVWNGMTLIGLLPDAAAVKVRGHIVRRRPADKPPAAPAAAKAEKPKAKEQPAVPPAEPPQAEPATSEPAPDSESTAAPASDG
jgi:hypothetical protein